MRNESLGLRALAIALLLGAAPAVAMAYIDPGNGAYMVQVIFTLAGAAIFYVRHPIQTVKSLWRWRAERQKERRIKAMVQGAAARDAEDAAPDAP